jgi:hypothetical protein
MPADPVRFPSGCARLAAKRLRIGESRKGNRDRRCGVLRRAHGRCHRGKEEVHLEPNELGGKDT